MNSDNYFYFNINIPEKRNIAILSNGNEDYFFLKEAIYSFNEKYNNFNLSIYNYSEFLISDVSYVYDMSYIKALIRILKAGNS